MKNFTLQFLTRFKGKFIKLLAVCFLLSCFFAGCKHEETEQSAKNGSKTAKAETESTMAEKQKNTAGNLNETESETSKNLAGADKKSEETTPEFQAESPQIESPQPDSVEPQTPQSAMPQEEQPKSAFQLSEFSSVMYAAQAVNIRSGPSTDYERIGSLYAGQEVTVTGQADTGWADGQIGAACLLKAAETAYSGENRQTD